MAWVTGRDTGTSSLAIWSHMMTGAPGDNRFGVGHPHDADDFGRCYRLLAIEPAWRARIGEMARYSAEWAALAARWDELSAMYETAERTAGSWEKWRPLCDVLRDLLTAARVCTDCGMVGMTAWKSYPDGTKRCWKCAQPKASA
jgi:hypothetical protein